MPVPHGASGPMGQPPSSSLTLMALQHSAARIMALNMSLRTGLAEGIGNDFGPSAFLDKQPLHELVVRIARRWVMGILRCAMQASKSSMKQALAVGSSVS